MHPTPAWAEFYERWHEFFLMSGTAAVTLAGLLFVSISIHVETLVRANREHLLELARATLLSFVMVLVLSLMMLVPDARQGIVGLQLLLLGGVFLALTARLLFTVRAQDHADFSLRLFRRRLIMPLVAYLWVSLTGVLLLTGDSPYVLHYLLGAVCTLLGAASGTSWELLVRVARIRRGDTGEPERG